MLDASGSKSLVESTVTHLTLNDFLLYEVVLPGKKVFGWFNGLKQQHWLCVSIFVYTIALFGQSYSEAASWSMKVQVKSVADVRINMDPEEFGGRTGKALVNYLISAMDVRARVRGVLLDCSREDGEGG